jgi:hypothetical protein
MKTKYSKTVSSKISFSPDKGRQKDIIVESNNNSAKSSSYDVSGIGASYSSDNNSSTTSVSIPTVIPGVVITGSLEQTSSGSNVSIGVEASGSSTIPVKYNSNGGFLQETWTIGLYINY